MVSTSETIFYAQGGGQPSDTGTMQSENTENPVSFEVSVVRTTTDGQILHLGRFVPSGTQTFVAGQSVKQAIDGVKRKLHSRIHTAGHIVGLAVRYLAESIPNVIELKAQHYPDSAFVEFRGLIEGKHKEAVQAQVDSFVQQTLPVKVYWWNQQELKEKCAVVPENVVIPDGGFVRAVDIEGAGAYPCGGTHVGDTSQVGKVELRRISRQKGVSKISYSVANA